MHFSYEDHECAIEVKNMNYEYLGVWKCQVQISRFIQMNLIIVWVRYD